jgi:phosphate starvation-inducible PhoH-like protein
MIVRHTFTPHNNTRLSHLCGPMDAHLRTIEAALQVSIAHRHEQFKVDGPKAKATRAMEVLQALYEMAERAIPADKIQLMLAGEGESLTAGEDGAVVLHTRRADLRARTINQGSYLENIASHDITFGIGACGYRQNLSGGGLRGRCAGAQIWCKRIVLTRPAVEAGERLGFLTW